MKKMLLLLVCLTTFAWLHAETATFSVNTLGATKIEPLNEWKLNDNISFSFKKNSGSNVPTYFANTDVRLYAKNTATLTAANGYKIESVEFTLSTQGKKQYAKITSDAVTMGPQAKGDTKCSWSGDVSSVTFTVGSANTYGTSTKSAGQLCFTSVTVTYTSSNSNQLAAPTFTPASGSAVVAGSTVTIACEEGANVYYTTDETNPTEASTPYTEPIVVNEAMTIKAIAYMEGKTPSSVATATYTIMPSVANIAEFIDLIKNGKDGLYSIQTSVTAVYQNGSNLYITDGKDWMLVYGNVEKEYKNGDVIAKGIVGKPLNYSNGLYELSNPDASTFAAGVAGSPVEPLEVTEISAEDVNKYVKVQNVNITGQGAYAQDANGNLFTIYDKFKIKPSDATGVNLIGFVGVSKGALQIYPTEITKGDEVFVAAPTFNPAAGEVEAGTKVEIDCKTADAKIYYTTDETDPTETSTLYDASTGIIVNEAMTIKAIAVKEGLDNSAIASATYTIKKPVVATPMFDPESGEVEKGTPVTITCATEGATFLYQINEGEPQVGVSGMTITINEATTIEVVASKDGYEASSASATYTIKGEAPMSYIAQFDFSDPTKLNPAQKYPSFEGMNPSGSDTREFVAGVEFTNHYVVVEFVAPGNATASNTPQIMYNTDAENNKIAFVRAFKNSGFKITGLRKLQIEKIEITGKDLKNILYNGSAVNSKATTELVWERSAVSALAETSENDVVEFKISSSNAASINAIKVTTLDITNGVDDIIVDENAPIEYYNLQGVRVANPENGIYIRRQGSKVSKVLVR